jgi:hypothetical protein
MPSGGFSILIALPLQRRARESGNCVFVDDKREPLPDQWAFLSTLHRLSSSKISEILGKAETDMPGGVIGVRLPVEDENADEPWKMTQSRRRQAPPVKEPLPDSINVVLADQVYIDRTGLPPSLVAQLVRIAAFQNPEFYRAQAMRLPTYGKPRIISCAELHPRQHFTKDLVVLYGGMTTAERRETEELLKTPDTDERLVLATGRYLGEGFDDASLGTLFLTMQISWRGTLAQYVGRLHREHHAKREVIVYDYVDSGVPLLTRMALKRQTG